MLALMVGDFSSVNLDGLPSLFAIPGSNPCAMP